MAWFTDGSRCDASDTQKSTTAALWSLYGPARSRLAKGNFHNGLNIGCALGHAFCLDGEMAISMMVF